jgi:hypothetical protein
MRLLGMLPEKVPNQLEQRVERSWVPIFLMEPGVGTCDLQKASRRTLLTALLPHLITTSYRVISRRFPSVSVTKAS